MSPQQKARERAAFYRWADAHNLRTGTDEGGYYDDEPAAAVAWGEWLAKAEKKYPARDIPPMLDSSWYQ